MREFLLFALYVFAAIGITRCLYGLVYFFRRPKIYGDGCYVIPLYDTPAEMEVYLRGCLDRLRWNGAPIHAALLVDMGLGEESLSICAHFIRQNPGLILCGRQQVSEMIEKLSVPHNTI